jgi:hypothetical protein
MDSIIRLLGFVFFVEGERLILRLNPGLSRSGSRRRVCPRA